MPENAGRGRDGKQTLDLTCDVHVHDAGASPDAVGGVAHVRAGQVVGHGALEEQGVVFDFHITGQRAVQAAEREEERKGDDTDTVYKKKKGGGVENYTWPQFKKEKEKKNAPRSGKAIQAHEKYSLHCQTKADVCVSVR